MADDKNMFRQFMKATSDEEKINHQDHPLDHSVESIEVDPEVVDFVSEQTNETDRSILPWDEQSSISTKYSKKLREAGYNSVRLLATATTGEIHELTGIPEEYAEQIVTKAKEWCHFKFETAANILDNRTQLVHIPTGSRVFDQILGGGIEPKSITEFYGAFTTGKTQLCIQLAVNAASPKELGGLDGEVIYIDTEGSFRPERVMQICRGKNINPQSVLDRIFVGRAHNTDIQMQLTNHVIQLAKEKDIKLLVVDSLTSTFRAEYIGKGALLERQQKLNQHVRQLSRIADLLNIAVVITNQVMSVINSFENTVIPVGGNILAHGSTHRIHFKKSSKRPSVRYVEI
ncbi:MAG: DNA repair and recombination protein RadA, partial [Candidatus Kariarchaeaceae archaeon]